MKYRNDPCSDALTIHKSRHCSGGALTFIQGGGILKGRYCWLGCLTPRRRKDFEKCKKVKKKIKKLLRVPLKRFD